MKNIIISIHPKYCELIASGEKTIEVRKTAPKAPFRAFIYCTKDKWQHLVQMPDKTYRIYSGREYGSYDKNLKFKSESNRKIIGEFICDKVDTKPVDSEYYNAILKDSCLTMDEIINYCNGNDLKALHITALKIYDKPRELAEFYKPCKNLSRGARNCNNCDYSKFKWYGKSTHIICRNTITRPPQSWQYVETPDWAEEEV